MQYSNYFPKIYDVHISNYVAYNIELFMDDFTVYGDLFDQCLENLDLILKKCIESNLLLNYEKCHFMVE